MAFKPLLEDALWTPALHDKLESYYEKDHRLEALGVTLPPDVRILEMVSTFPKLAVDVMAEVLNPEGFVLQDNDEVPELLRTWWQANNLDTELKLGITESLVQGLSFAIVGPGTADTPRFTFHDRKRIRVRRGFFGEIAEAVVVYREDDSDPNDFDPDTAQHYTPGLRQEWKKSTGIWRRNGEAHDTGTQYVPIVPFRNRSRLKDVVGRSEMLEVLDLADAESRSLTNLQIAQELLALPQRYLFADGIKEFKDQSGNPISKFKAYMASIWTGPSGATAGQFPGADLGQIINITKLYGMKVSSITGIPPNMLGISTDNPVSAEAMRAAKERLITKGEFKQHLFGDDIENMMKIGLDMYSKTPKGVETLETNWRDIAMPSKSAEGANILQAHSQGVVSAHTARTHLPLTPEQRAYEDQQETEMGGLARTIGVQPRRPAPWGADAEQ